MGSSTLGPVFTGFNSPQSRVVNLERTLGMPDDGPKCVPIVLDFTVKASYALDFSTLINRAFISMVQTLFVDASTSGVDVTIDVPGSGQTLKIKSGTQGYYPVLMPNPVKFTATCSGGPSDVKLQLMNFPVNGFVWTP